MADTKITALTAITTVDPANDVLPIVDVSDTSMAASGTTKKITTNQILGASGTATLASATITGNLTLSAGTANGVPYLNASKVVTTSDKLSFAQTGGAFSTTFNINSLLGSANYKGGIVVTEDDNAFTLYGGSNYKLIDAFGYSTPNQLRFYASNVEQYRIGASGVFNWYDGAGGTRMTLNSTGLGVGRSPSYRLQASSGTKTTTASLATVAGITTTDADDFGIYFRLKTDATGANRYAAITSFDNGSGNGARDLVLQDLGGNVGIGITPSAWATSTTIWRALDLQYSCGLASSGAGSGEIDLLWNAYYDQTDQRWEFKYTGDRASRYAIGGSGVHAWYNTASTGTANGAITWTQAMTLDASGNLLVGTTTNGGNGVSIRPSTASPNVVLVGSDTSGGTAWQLYSTGTSSNRFYVTWAGVVNAVNTTISGISDARLKENVQDIDVGLGAILALKPRKFDWKAGKGKDIKGDRGFIAQEFEQVFPQLVDEWADPAPEGEAPYKSVRQDLIPVLVKAIQELAARVQTLETR